MSDYQDRVVHLTYRGAIDSIHLLRQICASFLHYARSSNTKIKHGKQSLRMLNRQNRELVPLEIPDVDMKALENQFRDFSVDFSVKYDKFADKTHVFFKAADVDRVYLALSRILTQDKIRDMDIEGIDRNQDQHRHRDKRESRSKRPPKLRQSKLDETIAWAKQRANEINAGADRGRYQKRERTKDKGAAK